MNEGQKMEKLADIFNKYPEIKLAYLFGSRARDEAGPISDYDFAVYLDTKDKNRIFSVKTELLNQLSLIFETDKIDVAILNSIGSPELKYNIISEGKLIFEKEPFKIIIEPKILNEYFDFRAGLLRYGLTHV